MSGFIFFFLICDNVEKVQLYNSFKRVCKPLYFDENRFANIVIIYMIQLIYIYLLPVFLACWSVFFSRNACAVLCTQATVVPLRRLVVTPNKSRHRQDLWQASSGGLNNEERWYVQVSCVYRFFFTFMNIYIYLWQNMKWKPQICTRQRKMLKDMKYV